MIELRIPDEWLEWVITHPKALFLDFLMFFGFGCLVVAAFLLDVLVGVSVLGLSAIVLAILIATTTGGTNDGNA